MSEKLLTIDDFLDKYQGNDLYRDEAKAQLQRIMAAERLDQAKFYYGTLSDHDLRELDRTTLNTWRMDIAQLEQRIAAGEDEA